MGEAREATPSLPVPSGGLTGSREGVRAPANEIEETNKFAIRAEH